MDRELSGGSDRDIGSGSISGSSALLGFFCVFIMGSVDSNLDGDGASTNILAFESGDCLLLLFLSTNVDKSIALAFPRLPPAPANNAGGGDSNSSISEQRSEASIINVESKVGNKEHGLGRLAGRVLTSGARGTRDLGLANTCFLASSRVFSGPSFNFRGTAVRYLAFGLNLGLALVGEFGKNLQEKIK